MRLIAAEGRIIPEIADVVDRGDEVETPPFPFSTDEALVPRNRARRQRERAVVIIAQEVVGSTDTGLRLPGEEVVPSTRKVNLPQFSVGIS